MRGFRRPQVMPPTLHESGPGGKKAKALEEAFTSGAFEKAAFPGHWNEPDVRGVLIAMQGRICAYCSRCMERYDEMEVEHFRPKANVHGARDHPGYWWLAYRPSNYFLSCRICNSTGTKGTKFPLLSPHSVRVSFADRLNIHTEERALIDFCADSWVENHISVDDLTCLLRPKPSAAPEQKVCVEETVKFFFLNNDPLTLKGRIRVYDDVLKAIKAKDSALVRAYACRFMPYSVVARELSTRHDLALPSEEEELRLFLNIVVADLISALELRKQNPGNKRAVRVAGELMWALAALWIDPPSGTEQDIESFLTDRGLQDAVKPYRLKLESIPRPVPGHF